MKKTSPTYYMRCKKYVSEMGTPRSEFRASRLDATFPLWIAWVKIWSLKLEIPPEVPFIFQSFGRNKEAACRRLWEGLVECGLVEKGAIRAKEK